MIGDPTAASAAKGERLLDAAAEAIAELLLDDSCWARARALRPSQGAAGRVELRVWRQQCWKPQEKEDYVNVRIGSWVNVRHWLKHVVLERHEDLWQPA